MREPNALDDGKPVEIFEDRGDMFMRRGAGEGMDSRVLDVLKSMEEFGG